MRFPAATKILKNSLSFDKITESLKVGTFLRHSVYCYETAIPAKGRSNADAVVRRTCGNGIIRNRTGVHPETFTTASSTFCCITIHKLKTTIGIQKKTNPPHIRCTVLSSVQKSITKIFR